MQAPIATPAVSNTANVLTLAPGGPSAVADSKADVDATATFATSFGHVLAAQVDAMAMTGEMLLDRTPLKAATTTDQTPALLEQLMADINAPSQFLQVAPLVPITNASTVQGRDGTGDNPKSRSSGEMKVDAGIESLRAKEDVGMDALSNAMAPMLQDERSSGPRQGSEQEVGGIDAASSAHGGHASAEAHKAASGGRSVETQSFNPRHIPEPVKSPGWSESLGQRVVWMTKENVQVVHLQVEPPNLGPIEVQLNLTNDQANVVFVSAHAAVREAISDSLSHLNDLLAAGGVSLGSVSVNTQSQPGQGDQGASAGQGGTGSAQDQGDERSSLPSAAQGIGHGIGLVDTFA